MCHFLLYTSIYNYKVERFISQEPMRVQVVLAQPGHHTLKIGNEHRYFGQAPPLITMYAHGYRAGSFLCRLDSVNVVRFIARAKPVPEPAEDTFKASFPSMITS